MILKGCSTNEGIEMAYSDKVIDHYNNPRNVGSLDKNNENVGTGLVGAPECGDVMKLQIQIVFRHLCWACYHAWDANTEELVCPELQCKSDVITTQEIIVDSKFKTFGCGS